MLGWGSRALRGTAPYRAGASRITWASEHRLPHDVSCRAFASRITNGGAGEDPSVVDPFGGPTAYPRRDLPRASRYWPPPGEDSPAIPLPRGRKEVSVRAMKSDVDGYPEAQVVFSTRGGHRLFYLSEEELTELEKLAPRISEYLELWQEKAQLEHEEEEERQLRLNVQKEIRSTEWMDQLEKSK
eukprot:gnl/TRDRNA2_/TRDRNA2_190638_c0_seq1.p1 gnl/TRDRNA2_/TRDRNA2_190638_c0~~gnl/TRDRNA2_/TRDRNA2_190638_c0_seq1.p1  ORF type:complete len:185 (+),score=31.75 gnl/TRDRNA2_/TRDRNA2_190638_c0_seq1:37-591(+)